MSVIDEKIMGTASTEKFSVLDKTILDILDPTGKFRISKDVRDIPFEYCIPEAHQKNFVMRSREFAQNLQRLHGIKPPNRKVFKHFKYSGGDLNIDEIMNFAINQGEPLSLRESRRVRVNPQRPRVAFLFDISASMSHSRVTRASYLLGISIAEFLGNGFASEFSLATIGDENTITMLRQKNPDSVINFLIDTPLDVGGTSFIPPITKIEESGFYGGSDYKYVFVITDGYPELYNSGGKTIHFSKEDLSAYEFNQEETDKDSLFIIDYVSNRWNKNPKVEYFWMQLGNWDNVYEFIVYGLGFLPKKEDIIKGYDVNYDTYLKHMKGNIPDYEHMEKHSGYVRLGEFFTKEYKEGNFMYLTNRSIIDGTGFHEMIEYFISKFKKFIK